MEGEQVELQLLIPEVLEQQELKVAWSLSALQRHCKTKDQTSLDSDPKFHHSPLFFLNDISNRIFN